MNQVVTGLFLGDRSNTSKGQSDMSVNAVAAAVAAVERCLAQAHEAGDAEAVRLLHAVSAILASSPHS